MFSWLKSSITSQSRMKMNKEKERGGPILGNLRVRELSSNVTIQDIVIS